MRIVKQCDCDEVKVRADAGMDIKKDGYKGG